MGTVGVNAIAPFFALMLAGYLAGRLRLMPAGSTEALSRFVFLVSMPALFIAALSRTPLEAFFDWAFLAVLGGGMLIMYAVALVVARTLFPGSPTAHGLHALAATFSSTAYIGLPLLLTVFGDIAMVPGIVGAVITGAVFAPIAIIIAELDHSNRGSKGLWASVSAILTSPPIVATAIGLSLSAFGVELPGPVAKFCDLLGGAFVPCMLFSAGLFISSCSFRGAKAEIGWLVCAKLLIHPAITYWLAYHVFTLSAPLAAIAVIQAALPIGVPLFVFAQQYNTRPSNKGIQRTGVPPAADAMRYAARQVG